MINRRDALKYMAACTSLASMSSGASRSQNTAEPGGLGLVIYCCQFRRKKLEMSNPSVALFKPSMFLDHCVSVGAGGMQVRLGALDHAAAIELREKAETHGKYIEAIVSAPKDEADTGRFDAEVKTAALANAKAIRTTIIPGRR